MSVSEQEQAIDAEARPVKSSTTAVAKADESPPKTKPTVLATAKSLDDVPLLDAAKALMASGLAKNNEDAGKLMAKLDLGRSLGLSAVTAVNGIHLMQTGVVMSAAVMRLLINRNSHAYKVFVKQRDAKGCVIEAYRKEEGDWASMGVAVTFGPDDAKRAGLDTKETYKRWPVDMYYNRALAATFRTYMPDCAGGNAVYLPEEIDNSGYKTDPTTGDMVADAEYEKKSTAKPKTTAAQVAKQSESPLDRVKKLIEETKTDAAKFLTFYKVSKVDDLPAKDLAHAEQTLLIKKRSP